jgi:hypothetical protein
MSIPPLHWIVEVGKKPRVYFGKTSPRNDLLEN